MLMCHFWNDCLKQSHKIVAQVNDLWPWHGCVYVTAFLCFWLWFQSCPASFPAWGNCSVWEGDCAAGGPGEVDCTRLPRMGPLSEGRASQTLRAPGAWDQREAGGPPSLQREHPDQRTQLQGCPEGEGTARWAPAETSISLSLFQVIFKAFLHFKRLPQRF